MSPYTSACRTCAACQQPLPRAALYRCPLCREPVQIVQAGINIQCRRCKSYLPRAHAGKCPICTVGHRKRAQPLTQMRDQLD